MCEVTKHNFKKLYPEVEANLKKSTFISVDCEFSGLVSKSEVKNSLFDTGCERYLKLKDSINQFIVLQVGISAFKFIRDLNEYSSTVYNFYIFPRSFGSVDSRFLCQSSSFEFLCSYNFDFNKVVYDGISYLNKPEEAILHNELFSGSLFSSMERSVSLDDEKSLQLACSNVARWVTSSTPGESFTLPTPSYQDRYSYLLHQELRRRFSAVWTFNSETGVLVKKITEEERKQFEAQEKEKCLEEECIDDLVGFSKIFKLLVDVKKPIIGHNLFLDLLIMYNQFYEPLPASLKEFKSSINNLFPTIFDTKFISYEFQNQLNKEDRFGSNSLGNLYDFLKTRGSTMVSYSPKVKLDPGYTEGENEKIHEAGWDSYITGYCFIKMAHITASKSNSTLHLRPLTSLEHFAAITSMKNKVNIVRATLSHLNLEGSDPVSTRPPLLYVSGKGKLKIKKDQLLSIFAKYGAVDVKSVDQHSALVAVSNFGSVRDILRDFKSHHEIKVEKYGFLRHSRLAKVMLWSGVIIPLFGFSLISLLQTRKS